MKLIITNKFHNFEKETKSSNVETIKRILRSAAPADCVSLTEIHNEEGNRFEIFDKGLGEELVCVA